MGLNYIEKITAPVLLFHGQNDRVVPHQQSVELAKGIQGRGGICEFVSFPDEGHGFRQLKHIKEMYNKIGAFLNRYVICKQSI